MYRLAFDALCLDCHSDQLFHAGVDNDAILESALGLILLDFLGTVAIEKVRLLGPSPVQGQESRNVLHMQASGLEGPGALPLALLQSRLEEALCCALLDHFEVVLIETMELWLEHNDTPMPPQA